MPLSTALATVIQNPETPVWNYTHISTATTTLVKTGRGVLHSIVVNTTTAFTITVDDALTATTPTIAVMKASIAEGTYLFDCAFTVGLTIVTGGASDITVNWV
jgi:hypothetical protein